HPAMHERRVDLNPALHNDRHTQRLQHRLHHNARRAGRGHAPVRDVQLRARHHVAAVETGHGVVDGVAAAGGLAHRRRRPIPASRGGLIVRQATLARCIVLALILGIVFVPMYWIVVTSFKTGRQILLSQSVYVPRPFTLDNYVYLFEESRFALWIRNSAITASASTLLSLLKIGRASW